MLITAGAGGIGAAIARAFHAAGAQVHVCDIDRLALDRLLTESPGLTGTPADASVPADVDAVFEGVRHHLGGLDVLVNNAGIAGPTAAIEDIDAAAWERTLAVNLDSQFHFARRAVPLLKASGRTRASSPWARSRAASAMPTARPTPPASGPSWA
ncbi:MAG: SDR family oxidoreductase [Cellvibrionaceae bacterium]|nr:SDR family oxidoreductase [Cellvibrionaceae bacterium]